MPTLYSRNITQLYFIQSVLLINCFTYATYDVELGNKAQQDPNVISI